MIKLYCIFFVLFLSAGLQAQVPTTSPLNTEQQLEATAENNVDNDTEDDSFLQQMQQLANDPINLNTAGETELKELLVLSPIQVNNLLAYRKMLGNFISIYELQAVPGWDIRTIEKIRPFITVSITDQFVSSLVKRLKGGQHSILVRGNQVIERSKGYRLDSSTATNFYPGSAQKIFVRYKYQYKNLLQYGILGEKDAGEQFFKGAQSQGFDFYSAHFFARNIGIIKALALGDFTVNLGQGLIQWQSLAFKKSSDVINIKRQLPVLRPYNASGEVNFHRGIGLTVGKRNLEATVFVSYRKLDANFVADTLNQPDFISSLQTSGYHRTQSELHDKGVQRQLTFGGNITYNKNNLHIGINGIQYRFKLQLNKPPDPYNLFAIAGKSLGNYSIDYSYTRRNFHFFGETAVTGNFDKAFVNGLLISVDPAVDLSLLYRSISKSYQSLYTNAFTESTFPNNEQGVYTGISVNPNNSWRFDGYMDFFKFPWLKYQVDAPSTGEDYLIQATYKPNKQLEIYARYRAGSKSGNYNPSLLTLSPVVSKTKQGLRLQLNYRISQAIMIRNRNEILWFNKRGEDAQTGFLAYADIIYKPMMKTYAGSFRLQYFETDGYNSRLYAFENDVLYSYSIPLFYGKGAMYYININYDWGKKLSCWLKWSQTIYKGKTVIGSGLDEINGNTRSEIKLQLQYLF